MGQSAPQSTPLVYLDSVLRGIGQVMLQNSRHAGLVFLLGLFYSSAPAGVAALIGSALGTAVALLLGAERSQVRDGLFGFNGALVAIAMVHFLEPGAATWGYAVLAVACATVLSAAMQRLLGPWQLSALTAPFVITTLCFVLAITHFGHLKAASTLPMAGFPQPVHTAGVPTLSTVTEGLFSGLAQIFFQANPVTGVIFALGLLINSRRACLVALLGSGAGLTLAWSLGAAESTLHSGAFGFNSALAALALSSSLLALRAPSILYGVLAVGFVTVAYATISAALAPVGLPALTLPFVLSVWLFALARPLFARI